MNFFPLLSLLLPISLESKGNESVVEASRVAFKYCNAIQAFITFPKLDENFQKFGLNNFRRTKFIIMPKFSIPLLFTPTTAVRSFGEKATVARR
ncbi:hypothetical protein B9Z55_022523 [Caenorhabditis nigoni]|uniref:Serpin domain-containing protein n=1 Tax=Caenorhabditis nigoni TaxID=1611254 RepID=A0A2G5SKH8_9PELO|nr:hypothetical protein B9Z55_022523 [Caenorhabditis nigoni]